MPKKTPPHEDYPQWTTARFWSFIRSQIRAGFRRWPPKYECLADAKRAVTGQRHKAEYQCNLCSKWFKQKDVEVDHIEPAGSLKGWEDVSNFVRRVFVSKDKLQVLCNTCHKAKTKQERSKNEDD